MHILTKIIKEDMKPALGVTEPGAIAFAVAKAKSYIQGNIEEVKVRLNSGILFLVIKMLILVEYLILIR